MKTEPRLHRVYHFREPEPLTVEIHEPDCACPACAPWREAEAVPPALTLREIGARVWLGLAIGNAIAFAVAPHAAWAALASVFVEVR